MESSSVLEAQPEGDELEPGPAIEPEEDFSLLPRKRKGPARVVAVMSGKAGTGKSVVAANLAGCLAHQHGMATAVLDLSLQFGDQALMFDGAPSPSLVDVLANVDALTPDFVLECMLPGPDHLRVLAAPPSPELADLVEPQHVAMILGMLRDTFDFVVIDTSSHVTDINLEVVEEADIVVLVATPYLASVKNTKLLLKLFSDLDVPGRKLTAILNRVEPGIRMSLEVLEANLKFPLSHELPHAAQALVESVTDGVPLTVSKPGAEFAQRVAAIAAQLVSGSEKAEQRKGPRRSFLGLGRG